MPADRKPTSIHRECRALAGVLLARLESEDTFRPLRNRLAHAALELVEAITMAARAQEQKRHLMHADGALSCLRAHLEIAHGLGVLPTDGYLAFIEQADRVGRLIGRWFRKLESV